MTTTNKIVDAITRAIVVSQGGSVDTRSTLEALAEVAARIAFQTKIAVLARSGDEFAGEHANRISRNLKALRKIGDKHPFAPSSSVASSWERKPEGGEWQMSFIVDPHERKRAR